MRARWRSEQDEWTPDGRKITSVENLSSIRQALEQGSIILEHWFYRGASGPDRVIFGGFDEFMEYLETKAFAGDALYVWEFADACQSANALAIGKCPDDNGEVPNKGAY